MKRNIASWALVLLLLASVVFANPIFSASSSSVSVTAGQTQIIDLTHTAVDNGALVAALEGSPSFVNLASFDATTIRLTAVPSASEAAAAYIFNATVKDNDNVLSKHTVTLIVLEAPVIGLNSTSSVKLGDDRQAASNPEADDEDDQIVQLAGEFTIKNDGISVITGLAVSLKAIGFQPNDINFTLDTTGIKLLPASLNPGQSAIIGFTAHVPGALDAVDSKKLQETAFKVGEISVTGTIGGKATSTVTNLEMQRENQLEVDKVRVCVNDRCKTVDDNDDVENIHPGDRITIEIIVENKYSDSDSEDVDFDDVEIEFDIDDGDFDEDDSETLGDLGADEEDSETFSFTVDDDVDDGNSDLVIRIFGEDENGAFHGEEIEITLEVERENHDVQIRAALLNPSTLTCGVDTTRASINFANIGKRDEDDTVIEVSIDELGITEILGPFELDEDDTRQEDVALVLPENREAKTYSVVVRTLYDTNVPSDEKVLELVVQSCDDQSDDTTVSSDDQQVTVQNQPVVQQRRQPVSASSNSGETESFTDSGWYIALLALIAVIVLGALIVLVVKTLGKSSEEL